MRTWKENQIDFGTFFCSWARDWPTEWKHEYNSILHDKFFLKKNEPIPTNTGSTSTYWLHYDLYESSAVGFFSLFFHNQSKKKGRKRAKELGTQSIFRPGLALTRPGRPLSVVGARPFNPRPFNAVLKNNQKKLTRWRRRRRRRRRRNGSFSLFFFFWFRHGTGSAWRTLDCVMKWHFCGTFIAKIFFQGRRHYSVLLSLTWFDWILLISICSIEK